MSVTISSLSTEYLRVPVRLVEAGVVQDPTALVVEFAFEEGDAEPTTWVAGSWETAGDTYYGRVLVGPTGTINPGDGTWWLWIRVTDSPEKPVRRVGRIRIT